MRHLRELRQAGLTHVHLLPSYDFGSVPEREEDQLVPEVRPLPSLSSGLNGQGCEHMFVLCCLSPVLPLAESSTSTGMRSPTFPYLGSDEGFGGRHGQAWCSLCLSHVLEGRKQWSRPACRCDKGSHPDTVPHT